MDIFFNTKIQYIISDSIDNVRSKIQSIIKRKWYDFSINLTGRFIDETSFIITPKWSFAIIRWIETDLTYLKGKLSSHDQNTIVDINIRPNSLFVILLYILALVSISEIFGLTNISKDDPRFRFLFSPLLTLIILAIIFFSINRLKKRFEQCFNLNLSQINN